MDISKKTITEKKVIAYDLGVQLNNIKHNLQIVNQSIMEDMKKEEVKEPKKK